MRVRPTRRTSPFPLLVGTCLLASCETRPAETPIADVTDSAGVRVTRITARPADLVEWTLAPGPDRVLTGVETGDSSALSPTGAVRWLARGDIVVVDLGATRILVFDSAGTYRRALGRRGDGPGEFRSIGAVSVLPGDTLTAFDGALRRLSYWHPDAGFIRSVSLGDSGSLDAWPAEAWAWRDSLVVVLQLAITPRDSVPPGAGVRRWPMRAHLTLRDGAGRVIATSPTFPGMYTGVYDGGDTRLPFSNQPFAAMGRDRVYFGSGQAFRLSYLAADFASPGELRWPAQQEALSATEVAAVRAETEAVLATRLPAARLGGALDEEFAPEILPSARPAIGRVFVDDEERVWIERFEATRLGTRTQKPGDQWTVLQRDGRPVARLRLPPAMRLEAVRGNEVLVVRRDSLDVETVARYGLVRP